MDAMKFSEEHETRQNIFLKQWPDAKVRNDGVLDIKPCTLEKSMVCCMACTECYQNFWTKEIDNECY